MAGTQSGVKVGLWPLIVIMGVATSALMLIPHYEASLQSLTTMSVFDLVFAVLAGYVFVSQWEMRGFVPVSRREIATLMLMGFWGSNFMLLIGSGLDPTIRQIFKAVIVIATITYGYNLHVKLVALNTPSGSSTET